MKWYSTATHRPILTCCSVLIARRNKISNDVHILLGEFDGRWVDWKTKEDLEGDMYEVAYFCYPDPIPEYYEDLASRQVHD